MHLIREVQFVVSKITHPLLFCWLWLKVLVGKKAVRPTLTY